MKQTVLYGILCLICGLALTGGGCAAPPKAEMEAAENALARAESDPDVAAYAEASLLKARSAVAQMQDAAKRKRYREAKLFASEAASAAERAINEGRAAGVRAREDASVLMETLKESLTETQDALDKAQKLPEANLDFEALAQDLDASRAALAEAETDRADNRTEDAVSKGKTVRADLDAIQTAIVNEVRSGSPKK